MKNCAFEGNRTCITFFFPSGKQFLEPNFESNSLDTETNLIGRGLYYLFNENTFLVWTSTNLNLPASVSYLKLKRQ